jgi:DNA-binding HxlR family transcriptional regulator
MSSGSRTYGQMCTIARSLDLIGERWSLLIVRELLLGPKRFKDLLEELPALGANRLSDRLKQLGGDGVVAKETLPPPGEAKVYMLTERGEQLRQPVVSFGRWGATLPIDQRLDPGTTRADLLALVRCAIVDPELIAGVNETYDFRVGTERFHIVVHDGIALPRSGPAPIASDVEVECDLPTLLMLDAGTLTAAAARRERRAVIEGPAAAVKRALAIMRRP